MSRKSLPSKRFLIVLIPMKVRERPLTTEYRNRRKVENTPKLFSGNGEKFVLFFTFVPVNGNAVINC